jgi:uncharacterized protein with GYD domain
MIQRNLSAGAFGNLGEVRSRGLGTPFTSFDFDGFLCQSGLTFTHKEGLMPHYLLQAAYTPEAWQAMVKNPHSRIEAIRPAIERLGGKLIGGWAAFGDYDTILIAELPTSVDAAAFAIAAAAGGSCRSVKTTPLLTAEEAAEAAKKASTTGYKPVAASAAAAKQ